MKSLFGYTRYQPCGLSQVTPTLWSVTSITAPISRYTHTQNWFAL